MEERIKKLHRMKEVKQKHQKQMQVSKRCMAQQEDRKNAKDKQHASIKRKRKLCSLVGCISSRKGTLITELEKQYGNGTNTPENSSMTTINKPII